MHQKNDVNILVDYLTFTIGTDCFVESVDNPDYEDETQKGIMDLMCLVFGFGDLEFTYKHGFNGYADAWTKDGITICSGGCDTIMVQMSGKGCRLYESLDKSLDWMELIEVVQSFRQHNFSRLDIACDTFGLLKMEKLMRYTLQQRYVSRFVDYFVGQGNKEESIIFGSPTSRMRLRIYNKTLERIRQLKTTENVPENWVRLEFQLRDKSADCFINAWQMMQDISVAYFGVMNNQIRFVKRLEENVSRSVTVPWWAKFLKFEGKIPMAYKGGLEYNLQSLNKYLFGQAGSSLKTWLELNNYDTDKLIEMVKYKKLNERQENLLQAAGADETELYTI